MRTTTFLLVGLSLLLVLSSSPKIANANGLKIHRPSSGEVILCEVPSRNILCGNSGHYAQATGGVPPYAWTCIPAQAIVFDASIDPILKRTIRIMAQANQACSPAIQLKVTDTAGNNNTVLINAVQLAWKVPEGPDRVVGVARDGEFPVRKRRLYFTATGQGIQASRLRVRGFHAGSPLPASGTIEVDTFRNSAAAITPLGPPNCQQGFGEWLVGVGVSGGCPVIENDQGDHWFDIHGVETSARVDDIEVDMLVEIQPPLLDSHPAPAATLRCFDGIGAHVLYTSVKMDFDLVVEEPEEAGKGARAYRADEENTAGTQVDNPVGVVQKAYPSSLGSAGYSLRIEALMGGDEPTYDVYDPEAKTISSVTDLTGYPLQTVRRDTIDLGINEGLECPFTLYPEATSSATNDSHVRVTLIHDDAEMGGGSCRDFIVTTSVAIEVTSPTPSPYDDTGGGGYERKSLEVQ